jgi:hypothetical protein
MYIHFARFKVGNVLPNLLVLKVVSRKENIWVAKHIVTNFLGPTWLCTNKPLLEQQVLLEGIGDLAIS